MNIRKLLRDEFHLKFRQGATLAAASLLWFALCLFELRATLASAVIPLFAGVICVCLAHKPLREAWCAARAYRLVRRG